jgi:DNA-nicking Smr family endonuclease
MSKHPVSDPESSLFREAIQGVKALEQDKIRPEAARIKQKSQQQQRRQQRETSANLHYFSDEYQPLLPDEGPMRWCSEANSSYELKKLRRGDYSPEIFLDLHGLTQVQAKREIAALIEACRRNQLHVASVMHGHGQNILKQRVPGWLAQHPYVEAFHQAPKAWGGSSALLVLVTLVQ